MLGLGGRRQDLADTGEPGKSFQSSRKEGQSYMKETQKPTRSPSSLQATTSRQLTEPATSLRGFVTIWAVTQVKKEQSAFEQIHSEL